MSKYITVKLTEDQLKYIDTVVSKEVDYLISEQGVSPSNGRVTFAIRLLTKLAKAKNK